MRSIALFILALIVPSTKAAVCEEHTEGETCNFLGFHCCKEKDAVIFCGDGQLGIISCLPGECGLANTSPEVPVICSNTH